jgi:tRNA pseudouridine32 synthase/23S rRNA pseudouridine746 synthase
MKRKIVFRENFQGPESNIVDYLHSKTGLSKSLIKKLMLRGAVWLTHKKRDRVRRAKKTLYPGNRIELFYDPKIEPKDLKVQIIKKGKDWSIWYKPAGMLTQGTDYGDEGTLLRQVEQEQGLSYLVHRLDSQTSGLVLFAHSKRKAAEISKALQNNEIKKFYQAEVLGHPHEQTID